MKTFKLTGSVTVSCYTEVEAVNEEEALKNCQRKRTRSFVL
jgi:hypothetical protein